MLLLCSDLAQFLDDGAKVKKRSEIKPHLTGGEFLLFCKSHTFFRHLNHDEGGGGVGRIVSDWSKMKGFNNDDV